MKKWIMEATLRILTFNIDVYSPKQDKRTNDLLRIVEKHSPDILVLQEFSDVVYENIVREIRNLEYSRYLDNDRFKSTTSEVLFSKHSFEERKFIPFTDSRQGRGLTCARIRIGGIPITILTSQFEKTDKSFIKERQFQAMVAELENSTHPTIFAGDTQIADYRMKLIKIPGNIVDTWYENADETSGYTIDYQSNPLSSPPYRDRPDKVYFSPGGCDFSVNNHTLITHPIVSRRFGVLTELKFSCELGKYSQEEEEE